MEISSADLCKLTVQEVLDMLIDQDAEGVMLKGMVDGEMCNVYIRIEVGVAFDD
ncbi:MAG: hypothetical protein IKF11_06970 [Methanobrevibacter sp.]|nr:hypothetical protein [Methanobrevibacter sp.]